MEKADGITFLVRVHDEEATLERSITSLLSLLFSYEILILLNMCTDASAAIAARLASAHPQHIRIYHYNHTLSRPGYETLATDFESLHSFPGFLNWGMRLPRQYKWVAKWDADFIMTPPLRDALHAEDRAGRWGMEHQILQLAARSEDGSIEYGDYFSSCFDYYRKDLFWETPVFRFDPQKHVRLQWTHPHLFIEHASSVNRIKPYWGRPGWYATEPDASTPEAALVRARLLELERDFGMMPMGMGRAGTTDDAVEVGLRIRAGTPTYVRVSEDVARTGRANAV